MMTSDSFPSHDRAVQQSQTPFISPISCYYFVYIICGTKEEESVNVFSYCTAVLSMKTNIRFPISLSVSAKTNKYSISRLLAFR